MTQSSVAAFEPGAVLDDTYDIVRMIHRGAATEIYCANHRIVGKQVAIKLLRQDASDGDRHRFSWEAQKLSSIAHPNVITVFDLGVTKKSDPYLVLEYLTGETLSTILNRDKLLPVKRVRYLFGQVCDAMTAFHQKNLVHRDLKPANLFVTTDASGAELVKVIDFKFCRQIPGANDPQAGRLRATSVLVGTPQYSSPEQCMGQGEDQRADIYSVGCCLYECLSGSSPFKGHSVVETMSKQVADQPAPLKGTQEIDDMQFVLAKCLEKDADKRFQTAAALKEALVGKEVRSKPSSKLRGVLNWFGSSPEK